MKLLRKGWEWVPLGKYVENHDGRRIPISKKERESRSGSFPYYGASGVIDTIDGFTHDGEFLLIVEDGANLLTRSKPLAFLTRGKVWVNNHAHAFTTSGGLGDDGGDFAQRLGVVCQLALRHQRPKKRARVVGRNGVNRI
jgi:hypothetical protein